jgi:hypothetical protein
LKYQPIREVRAILERFSETSVPRAKNELYAGKLDVAEELTSEAVLSNDRHIEP